jgi:hypothetical protein
MAVEQINLASESDSASLRAFESQQEQTIALELARLAEILGVGVMCYDLRSGQKIASTDDGLLPVIPPELMWQCVQSGASRVLPLASGLVCFALPFPAGGMTAHEAGPAPGRSGLCGGRTGLVAARTRPMAGQTALLPAGNAEAACGPGGG